MKYTCSLPLQFDTSRHHMVTVGTAHPKRGVPLPLRCVFSGVFPPRVPLLDLRVQAASGGLLLSRGGVPQRPRHHGRHAPQPLRHAARPIGGAPGSAHAARPRARPVGLLLEQVRACVCVCVLVIAIFCVYKRSFGCCGRKKFISNSLGWHPTAVFFQDIPSIRRAKFPYPAGFLSCWQNPKPPTS